MERLVQDLRFALRSLLRRPGFTLTAVVTLALGIGSTAAIFSVVDAVRSSPVAGWPSGLASRCFRGGFSKAFSSG